MAEFEIGRQVELGFQLNTEIKELEKNGFLLFGERRRSRMIGNNKKDLGFWDISIILIFYKENPAIVNNEYVVANITY